MLDKRAALMLPSDHVLGVVCVHVCCAHSKYDGL